MEIVIWSLVVKGRCLKGWLLLRSMLIPIQTPKQDPCLTKLEVIGFHHWLVYNLTHFAKKNIPQNTFHKVCSDSLFATRVCQEQS